MTGYKLARLAPGSYDVILKGEIVASAVRSGSLVAPKWTVELLDDLPPEKRPAPFTALEHNFGTFDAVRRWLGVLDAGVERDEPEGGPSS